VFNTINSKKKGGNVGGHWGGVGVKKKRRGGFKCFPRGIQKKSPQELCEQQKTGKPGQPNPRKKKKSWGGGGGGTPPHGRGKAEKNKNHAGSRGQKTILEK